MIPPPDSLKPIKPYLERGAELATRDPLVAYHCRLYALQVRERREEGGRRGRGGSCIDWRALGIGTLYEVPVG